VAASRRAGVRRWVGLGGLLLVVALVSGSVGGLVGAVATRSREESRTAAPAAPGAPAGDGTPSAAQVQQVAGGVLPAVVKVEASTDSGKATGSGVIFAKDGYVLTNAHVVSGAHSIGVTLATSEPLKARLVGRDLNYDLAVLRVRRSGLAVANFGRSAGLKVGDVAIVVGSRSASRAR
jgi:putative serine protease PepD